MRVGGRDVATRQKGAYRQVKQPSRERGVDFLFLGGGFCWSDAAASRALFVVMVMVVVEDVAGGWLLAMMVAGCGARAQEGGGPCSET